MTSSTVEKKPSARQTFAKTGYTVQSVPSEFSRPIFGRFFVSCTWLSALYAANAAFTR